MPDCPLLILTALDFEARPIARELGLRFVTRTLAVGETPQSAGVRLRIVGPRARHLPTAPLAERPRLVLMAGLAGGLSPDLRRGDLVVDAAGDPTVRPPGRRGGIATVTDLATTPNGKAGLAKTTGALVVDMENAVARDWAARHGLAFVGLRAVSDTADEPLDPATLRVIDEHGFFRPTRLAAEILRRPACVASFWRLRTAGGTARTLAVAVRSVAETLMTAGPDALTEPPRLPENLIALPPESD